MNKEPAKLVSDSECRRSFLNRVGRVTLSTPPVLALLLAAEGRNYAMAASGGSGSSSSTRLQILQNEVSVFEQLAADAAVLGQDSREAKLDGDAAKIQAEIERIERRQN